MYPILCHIGPFTLFSYGLMLFLAYVACLSLALYRARRFPAVVVAVPAEALSDLIAVSLLGGIVGGRLYYVLLNWDWFKGNWFEMIAIWHGGLVWYGGLLGGVAAAWFFLKRRKLSALRAADQLAPLIALGHAFGRIGCFLNGCCYGKPTEHALSVLFPGQPVAVWPTQLFEAVGLLFLFLALWWAQTPRRLERSGLIMGIYAVCYAGLRFVVEFFRGDLPPIALSLKLAQWISIAVMMIGIVLIVHSTRSKPQSSAHHLL